MGRGQVFPADEARSLLNPLRRLVQSPRRTVAAIGLRSADMVLEVGPGPGFFTPFIARAVPRGGVVLVDLQQEMVRLARQRLAHGVNGENIEYAQGDALSLPFASATFDAVFVATMLGEVPDRDGCVEELRRVVKTTGTVAVAETRRDSDFIKLDELSALFERHRFQRAGRNGPRWQYTARFRPTSNRP